MRILHTVEFYYPSVGGSQEVVRQLSERMAALGHEVTVATGKLPERKSTIHNGVSIVEFDILGSQVRGYQGDTQSYLDFLKNNQFDVIMNYAAQQWATDLFFEVMDQVSGRKIIVPCGFSGLNDPMYEKYFESMPNILRSYDAVVCLSPTYRDAQFAQDHNIPVTIIPNGADEAEFYGDIKVDMKKKLRIPKKNSVIMHLGSFTGEKGQSEAIRIFREATIKDVALVLVGNKANKKVFWRCWLMAFTDNLRSALLFKDKRIKVLSLRRDETVDLLKQSDLFLFPSNVEASPLVLFEACAAKTPFVTTDVGNAAEIIDWTRGGIIMPTTKDALGRSHADITQSAQLLDELMSSPENLKKLAQAGYKAWDAHYRWGVLVNQYIIIYKAGDR